MGQLLFDAAAADDTGNPHPITVFAQPLNLLVNLMCQFPRRSQHQCPLTAPVLNRLEEGQAVEGDGGEVGEAKEFEVVDLVIDDVIFDAEAYAEEEADEGGEDGEADDEGEGEGDLKFEFLFEEGDIEE